VDKAVVDHVADEERLIARLNRAERTRLAKLLRKLLLSEPFRALDRAPAHEPARPTRRPWRG
jgi:hypothetical protein